MKLIKLNPSPKLPQVDVKTAEKIDELKSILLGNIADFNLSQSSFLKPSKKPDLKWFEQYTNKDGVVKKVKIDWEIYRIKGTITLKGDWNIMYWEKEYFLLDPINTLGGTKHVYNVTRWFWVNDVLGNNSLSIKGTLSRTTREDHFRNDYSLTTPAIESGNETLFYPVVQSDQELTEESRKG